MREIKFRAKRIDNNEWVYGFLIGILDPQKVETSYKSWIIHDGVNISGGITVIPESVGQFTGLKDKAGKDIYEGDIVKWIDEDIEHTGEFFWLKDSVAFRVQMKKGYMPSFKLSWEHLEIIGNIHDTTHH